MEYILIAVIVLAACVYVCYPFFARGGKQTVFENHEPGSDNRQKSELQVLEENKLELYGAIKEIDFDYGLGKLSEDDYKELRNHYLLEASEIIKKIEIVSSGVSRDIKTPSVDDELEAKIRNARQKVQNKDDELELEIKKHRQSKIAT